MKRIKSLRPFIIVLLIMYMILFSMNANAKEINPYGELFEMEATAYCDLGYMANQEYVHEGVCAMRRDLIGKTAIIYDSETMNLIGIYEIKDTGGDYRIKNGSVVDIYILDKSECWNFGRKDVLVQIVEADG